MNLVINRFRVDINVNKVNVYFHIDVSDNKISKSIWAKYQPQKLLEFDFIKNLPDNNELKVEILNKKEKIEKGETEKKEKIENETNVFISFYDASEHSVDVDISLSKNKALLRKWLKETFIKKLKDKYIIEPFREGCDFSLYKETETNKNNIKKYERFDLVFHLYGNPLNIELSLSIGSKDSYIGEVENDGSRPNENIKVVENNLLIRKKESSKNNLPVKFNKELRTQNRISPCPLLHFYKEDYYKIREIAETIAKEVNEKVTIFPNFIIKREHEVKIVDFEKNKMIFSGGREDFSTINGMRDYGPFKLPDNISKIQLLFVYPDSESANKLANFLSRGYRHFPGLESYVGIPANFSGIRIKYDSNNLDNIVEEIKQKLPAPKNENLLAVCIMPFSKSKATEEQSKKYFEIKKILLEKNIPSQFIERDKIFQENFHFGLPNIAIAMLAKIGGIPWKLAKKHYKQLTVGFNIYRKEEQEYLGSAVYFDNEGVIQGINFSTKNNIRSIIEHLFNAISDYKEQNNNFDKLVIHYYKPLNEKENREIENSLREISASSISFAVVEINDTKTSTDICFDLDYERYMPQSGVYIKLKPNEYLLFNNLRYWEKPINPIRQEEYPIKLRIYDPGNAFDHHELISQVYEFSRLYWKSLKQKAQPVTTIYSKLVAEYMAHFRLKVIPNNETAKKTVWFI
ncbi:Piwi domain-containing protein [Melioribacter sp. OK-6-Me]|uniref:Piwi domain-containing protein n=1 Tax=unclassified Melioribacter TaxID=2627329 RepID=UPI003ED89E0C